MEAWLALVACLLGGVGLKSLDFYFYSRKYKDDVPAPRVDPDILKEEDKEWINRMYEAGELKDRISVPKKVKKASWQHNEATITVSQEFIDSRRAHYARIISERPLTDREREALAVIQAIDKKQQERKAVSPYSTVDSAHAS